MNGMNPSLNSYQVDRRDPVPMTEIVRGLWTFFGCIAAFVAGIYVFWIVKGSASSILERWPSWTYIVLAPLAGLPFLSLMFVPNHRHRMALAPILVALCSCAAGGVLGTLVKLVGYIGVPWLLLVLPLTGAGLWLWTLLEGDDAQERQGLCVDSRQRQHLDIDALLRPVTPAPVVRVAAPAIPAQVARPTSAVPAQPPALLPPPAAPRSNPPEGKASAASDYRFDWTIPGPGLASLAGMEDLKAEIRNAIAGFRDYPNLGSVHDRNGILLSGPPGNGKTHLAQAVAGELRLPLLKVGVQDLTSKWINESSGIIRELFRQASGQPCVLFFDEFDAVAASRGGDAKHAEDKKVVNALLAEIDKARPRHIVLMAATNFLEDIDPAIARDGRFDFRIEIPYPDCEARLAVLTGLMHKFELKANPATLQQVAMLWERRSISFIESTVKRLRDEGRGRVRPATAGDFKLAARAASRRASAIPTAGERLSELALAAGVRAKAGSLLARLRSWESVAAQGGEPPTGILLAGPPGTGKTSLVRALARELGDWHVFEVNSADVIGNPRKFREVVELAANHRPAFVFLDEADELLRDRRRSANPTVTNEILKAMDGLMGKVPELVFVAATNNPEAMDPAALRGGRFGERIEMPRLRGPDLVGFFETLLEQRRQVRCARDVTAAKLAREFGEIAPADAKAAFSQAVNSTFTEFGTRPITLQDIRRARQAMANSERGGTC